jgi:hypothetical protein
MKLARAKLSSDVRTPRKKKRQTTALTRFGISNSSTTSSSDTSSESETCSLPAGSSTNSALKKSKSNGLNGVKRLPSTTSSEDSDTTTTVPLQQRKKKRQKMRKSSSSSSNSVPKKYSKNKSDSDSKKSENLSSGQTSVPNHNALKLSTISSSHDSTSSLDDWDKPGLSTQCKKYSATPDSGIDLSASRGNGSRPADDSNEECEKLPVFTKSCKNRLFKRNYRSRVATDSDSD